MSTTKEAVIKTDPGGRKRIVIEALRSVPQEMRREIEASLYRMGLRLARRRLQRIHQEISAEVFGELINEELAAFQDSLGRAIVCLPVPDQEVYDLGQAIWEELCEDANRYLVAAGIDAGLWSADEATDADPLSVEDDPNRQATLKDLIDWLQRIPNPQKVMLFVEETGVGDFQPGDSCSVVEANAHFTKYDCDPDGVDYRPDENKIILRRTT